MNSKQQFIADIQQKEEERLSSLARQRSNISMFQTRTAQLGRNIKEWLKGIPGIELKVDQSIVFDDTLPDRTLDPSYQIDSFTISANGREMHLRPDALYLFGGMGRITVSLFGQRLIGEPQLIMSEGSLPDGEWALVTTAASHGANKRSVQVFDEEVFFQLIGGLLR